MDKGANLILIGGPGGGKTHLASAIGLALVENGWRVLFTRTSDLVQRFQVARRELALEAAVTRLDRFHLLILDDLAYVSKDQAETSVLFERISACYERCRATRQSRISKACRCPTIKPKLRACQRQSDRTTSLPLRSQFFTQIVAPSTLRDQASRMAAR